MEKQNVREAARDILNSKMSKMLLDGNNFPSRSLEIRLNKIDSDMRKQQALYRNEEQLFKRRRLVYSYEPTIVVRWSLPPLLQENDTGIYLGPRRKVTDAFKAVTSRKKNVWETTFTERNMKKKFCSMVFNSLPLSQSEQVDLEHGWNCYRPISRTEQLIRMTLQDKRAKRKVLAQSRLFNKPTETFITQTTFDTHVGDEMPMDKQARTEKSNEENKHPLKSMLTADFYSRNVMLNKFRRLRDKQKKDYYKFLHTPNG